VVWLEARPRDGTLYTAGLWQGVWSVARDGSGTDVAERTGPDGSVHDRVTLSALRAATPSGGATVASFVAIPPEFATTSNFTFLPPSEGGPGRWHEADAGAPVLVHFC